MGEKLLDDVANATGLPQDLVNQELVQLIQAAGLSTENLTLEELRQVLAEYVQDVLLAAQAEFSKSED